MKKGLFVVLILLVTAFATVIGCNSSSESDDIVSKYSFSGNANDDSENGYDGIVHGASLTSDCYGNQNSAYSFDGNDDYIEVSSPNEDDLDFTNALTLVISVKLQNDSDFQAFISKEEGSGYGLSYRGSSTDRMYFACHVNGDYRTVEALEPAVMDEWYHLVGTYDHVSGTAGEVKFYVNGVLQGTNSDGGDFDITNSPLQLLIGANPNQTGAVNLFEGVIDDVQLYRRAFSDSEVLSLYNEQKCSEANGTEPAKYTNSDIDADGGTLELTASDGTTCSLTIPSGVLTEATNIKITAEASSSDSSFGALSNNFLIEPEGLEFDTPVTITITVPDPLPTDRVPAILHTTANGHRVLLETQVDGQTLTASLTHFSHLSAVAPTADILQLQWDSVKLEINNEGLTPEYVEELVGIYRLAQNALAEDYEEYTSIDFSAWEADLRAYISDLIMMGSLECSNGNYLEAEHILKALLNQPIVPIMHSLFPDLEAQAEQALEDCQNQPRGTIVINQTPDVLSGSGWSLTGPRDEAGTGSMTLSNMPAGEYTVVWEEVSGYVAPPPIIEKTLDEDGVISFNGTYFEYSETSFPVIYYRITEVSGYAAFYVNDSCYAQAVYSPNLGDPGYTRWQLLPERDKSGYPWVQEGDDGLVLTLKFEVRPNNLAPLQVPSAYFEVMVNGEITISKQLSVPKGQTKEETETLTVPGVLPYEIS